MMIKFTVKPKDFECRFEDCPPGHFLFQNMIGFKSEYRTPETNQLEAFCDTGEFFMGDAKDFVQRANLIVTPIEIEVERS